VHLFERPPKTFHENVMYRTICLECYHGKGGGGLRRKGVCICIGLYVNFFFSLFETE
jgi:hypothetical protein